MFPEQYVGIVTSMGNLTLSKFETIIRTAAQPVTEAKKKVAQKKSGGYTGKKTRQRTTVNTSGKRRGTSHE